MQLTYRCRSPECGHVDSRDSASGRCFAARAHVERRREVMGEWEGEARAAVARAQAATMRAAAAAAAHAARAAAAHAARAVAAHAARTAAAHAACAVAANTLTTTASQAPLSELQSPEMLSSLRTWVGAARDMVLTASTGLLQLASARTALDEVAAHCMHDRIVAFMHKAEGIANAALQSITAASRAVLESATE